MVMKCTYAPGQCFYYIPDGPVLPAVEVRTPAARSMPSSARFERHRAAEAQTVSHLRIEPALDAAAGLLERLRGARHPRTPMPSRAKRCASTCVPRWRKSSRR